MVQDPVCGMEIEEKDAFATRESMGQTFHFCSQACVDKFDANPHAYMHHGEKSLASPVTTGVNPKLGDLRRVELPLVGLDSAALVPVPSVRSTVSPGRGGGDSSTRPLGHSTRRRSAPAAVPMPKRAASSHWDA